MTAVFDRYPGNGAEYALALALADNAHDDGSHIFPSVDTMAHKSRLDRRTVQKLLRQMVADGWLLEVRAGGGRGRSAEYRISPAWLRGESLVPVKGGRAPPFTAPVDNPKKGGRAPLIPASKRAALDAQKGGIGCLPNRTGSNLREIPPYPPQAGGGVQEIPKPPRGGVAREASGEGEQSAGGAEPPDFERVAALYPTRSGMYRARRWWMRYKPDAELAMEIERAIRAWSDSDEWRDMRARSIPLPGFATWLADQRWRDAPYAASPAVIPEQLRALEQQAAAPAVPPSAEVRARLAAQREALVASVRHPHKQRRCHAAVD